MVRLHHQLSGQGFEQTPGDNEGKGELACCSPWSHKERHDLANEKQEICTKYTFIFRFLSGKDIKILRFLR